MLRAPTLPHTTLCFSRLPTDLHLVADWSVHRCLTMNTPLSRNRCSIVAQSILHCRSIDAPLSANQYSIVAVPAPAVPRSSPCSEALQPLQRGFPGARISHARGWSADEGLFLAPRSHIHTVSTGCRHMADAWPLAARRPHGLLDRATADCVATYYYFVACKNSNYLQNNLHAKR